ncbi:hypothetical protein GRF61_09230 [Azoarcus sp. TTM-91]|uniref:hypothetical protein n=1 Tax=Azoarcus sp. TTM-91 TaxID=2691581 RepID=UPI00145D3455|nr:hypothetical protein [Azoarcus sp. TTM-91]NMG34624.1 hypothetical protein [Azoarcus sp. TTM-91]
MQIPALGSGTSTSGRRLAFGDGGVGRSTAPATSAGQKAASLPSTRGGLRNLDFELNRQVAGAQQALNFLDQAGNRLQALKSTLSGKLAEKSDGGAGPSAADARLAEQLRQFSALWRKRGAASAGTLDGQLQVVQAGSAQQRFRIRGLDADSLRSGDKETLSFSAAGKQVSVAVDPAAGETAVLRRLQSALAPIGMGVERSGGSLVFSVAEGDWPVVRDSLAVKGGGQRFPTGQFNRVRAEAEADAIQPQSWRADDTEAARQTLQEVLAALDLIRQARNTISRGLAEADARMQPRHKVGSGAAEADESDWAASFVQRFEAMAEKPDFNVFAAVAPALTAVSRDRVMALLGMAA